MRRIAVFSFLCLPALALTLPAVEAHAADAGPSQSPAVGSAVGALPDSSHTAVVVTSREYFHSPGRFDVADEGSSGWFGDLGFYVLSPSWSGSNPAFASSLGGVSTQTDFDHGASFAPLVQIGFAGERGLGVRGRWWTLDSSDNLAIDGFSAADGTINGPSPLGTGGSFGSTPAALFTTTVVDGDFSSRLRMDVIDLEAIWKTTMGRSTLLLSSGVRYAHIGQTYDGSLISETTTLIGVGTRTSTLQASQTFNGAGPTFAMQAFREIGHTNLSVYGLGRGSVLFGESRQVATGINDPLLGPTATTTASLFSNSLRPVMELELGANWTRCIGNLELMAEGGFVGMVWYDAGNSTNSDSILGGSAGTRNANQDLGLIGLRFASGIRF